MTMGMDGIITVAVPRVTTEATKAPVNGNATIPDAWAENEADRFPAALDCTPPVAVPTRVVESAATAG